MNRTFKLGRTTRPASASLELAKQGGAVLGQGEVIFAVVFAKRWMDATQRTDTHVSIHAMRLVSAGMWHLGTASCFEAR